ncbi:Rab guanine nucleotide exchange factor SEC2 [Nakaseomyces bracarensis]|uniref:Rab guanine nucleotide exchange factor SEC2 n=1 Tax=Nakaseomyces bracarensis TaxID=273131 RepID=A0ABR4NQM4_9SACH
MSDPNEESKRISVQVSTLSTQLIESIDRQSELEKRLRDAQIIINKQKHVMHELDELKKKNSEMNNKQTEYEDKIRTLEGELIEEKQKRGSAEKEAEKLGQEVEDLTASLFDEANNMVADARREKYDTELLNNRLHDTLKEKDAVLETLTLQLKNLKKVLQHVDSETNSSQVNKRASVITTDTNASSTGSFKNISRKMSNASFEACGSPLYSPFVTTVRYDLNLYNEFLKFVAVLPHCSSIKSTSTESKLLKRLVTDEIQPVLRIDNASGIGWLVRKTLLTSMMEGQVVVEPLSGINEAYQLGYETHQTDSQESENVELPHMFNFPLNSPPIAVRDPCAICSENRDDIIEHARMYVLKTFTKEEDGTTSITNSFPLCHWCLIKVRQTCEIFAFLRSLKLGAWNLEKVTLSTISKGDSLLKFSQVTKSHKKEPSSEEKRGNRKSIINTLSRSSSTKVAPVVESQITPVVKAGQPTTNIQRAWVQLCKLRSMLHWAHIGIWNIDDSMLLKIGPISSEEEENFDSRLPDVFEGASTEDLDGYPSSEMNGSESFQLKNDGSNDESFDFEKKAKEVETLKKLEGDKGGDSNIDANNPKLSNTELDKMGDSNTVDKDEAESEGVRYNDSNLKNDEKDTSDKVVVIQGQETANESAMLQPTDSSEIDDASLKKDNDVKVESRTESTYNKGQDESLEKTSALDVDAADYEDKEQINNKNDSASLSETKASSNDEFDDSKEYQE